MVAKLTIICFLQALPLSAWWLSWLWLWRAAWCYWQSQRGQHLAQGCARPNGNQCLQLQQPENTKTGPQVCAVRLSNNFLLSD
jgi:hypothetical protein